jgi:hypothetical protein
MTRLPYEFGQPQSPYTVWRVELTSTLDAGGSATAKRIYLRAEEYQTSDAEITVWDANESVSGSSGDKFYVVWMADSRRWEILTGGGGGFKVGKTNSTLTKGSVVADGVSVWAGDIGSESDTGIDVDVICLFDTVTHSGGGVWVGLEKNPSGSGYYAIAKECGS